MVYLDSPCDGDAVVEPVSLRFDVVRQQKHGRGACSCDLVTERLAQMQCRRDNSWHGVERLPKIRWP